MKLSVKRLLAVALALVLCLSLLPGIAMAADVYTQVTTMGDITSGGQFVIVADGYAMGTTLSYGKIYGTAVTPSGDTLSGASLPVWTIVGASGGVSISVDGQYLAYESSTNFVMASEPYTWTVTAGEGGFILKAKDADTRGIFLQTSKSRFGAYSTSNTSGYVFELQLYKLTEGGSTDPIDPTVPSAPESSMTPAEIVDAAYALESGASMAEAVTLTGELISIDTPYSSQYSNITVTIVVEGKEDKPIQCFRMKGNGADSLAIGDIITVTGTL